MKEPARIAVNWAVGLPFVAGLIAWGFLLSTPWWLQLALSVAALAVLGYLFQVSSNWLFGPVLMYELVRQTRSARVPALRIGYALLLLLAMFLVYLRYTPGSGHERTLAAIAQGTQVEPNQKAAFAATFFYTFQALQFSMLLLFTPAMIGGSIASERQRGTLDLLLTTDLTNREIILGKLSSQLLYLFMLLLTGLPILSILQMLGGVDPDLIFVTFLGTVMSLITLGAVSLFGATSTTRVQDSLLIAYLYAFLHAYFTLVGSAPLLAGMDGDHEFTFIMLGFFGCYNAVVTGTSLYFTFRWLRPTLTAKHRRPVPRPRGQRRRPQRRPPPPRYPRPQRKRPALGDRDPMIWKELYYERGLSGAEEGSPLLVLGIFGAGLLVMMFVVSIFADSTIASVWNGITLYIAVPGAQIVLILASLRAAFAFSREREAQTFDSLITTSLTDQDIFRAKWFAALWNMRFWVLPIGMVYLIALCVGGLSPWAFLLALLAFGIHAVFVINLGLYCSAASTSTLRSTIATVVSLVLIAGGHWLIALVTQPLALALSGRDAANVAYDVHLWSLTLPWNLASVSFYREDVEEPDFVMTRLLPGLLGMGWYGGLALLLRWGVARRMKRYREG